MSVDPNMGTIKNKKDVSCGELHCLWCKIKFTIKYNLSVICVQELIDLSMREGAEQRELFASFHVNSIGKIVPPVDIYVT